MSSPPQPRASGPSIDRAAARFCDVDGGATSAMPREYQRAFAVVAFTMNRFIVDHLMRARRHFDNDVEMMLLFGVLSQLNVAHIVSAGARPSSSLDANGDLANAQQRLRPMRVRDLEQITGRPRETVRRRLERLRCTGRVHRTADGYVMNVDALDADLRALTVEGVRRFMQAAGVIASALHDAERVMDSEVVPH